MIRGGAARRREGREAARSAPLAAGAPAPKRTPSTIRALSAAIIGPRTMEQLEDSLLALDVQISDEDARTIDELVAPGTSAL